MKTYIPKQPKLTRERVELKLERALVERLDRYCEYLESDRDYVIGSVLQVVFKKDRGFGEWLAVQRTLATPQAADSPARGARG